MKIAMIGHKRIPSREGGVEIVVEELSTRMAKQGHSVTVYNRMGHHVSGKENDQYKKQKEYKKVKIKTIFTINKKGLDALIYSFFATILAVFKKYDVIHYHAEGPCAMIPIAKLFGKRVIATIHGLDWQRAKWGGFATKFLLFGEKMAAKYADEIIVLSENVKQYFKETYKRDVNYIPNGVNKPRNVEPNIIEQKYNLKKNEYILFLARIVPEKGLHYLIDAYNKIKTNKKLVIAGGASHTNDYYNEIKEIAKNNSNIIMTGFVQGEELEELFSNCYLYCLPSDIEGMPLSLLEAMSYGKNCLISDIKENSTVCDKYGFTFKKSDSNDLKKKLEKLLNSKNDLYSEKEIAKYVIEKYNWDDVTSRTLELYNKDSYQAHKKEKSISKCTDVIKILGILALIVFMNVISHRETKIILYALTYILMILTLLKLKRWQLLSIPVFFSIYHAVYIGICPIFLLLSSYMSPDNSKLQELVNSYSFQNVQTTTILLSYLIYVIVTILFEKKYSKKEIKEEAKVKKIKYNTNICYLMVIAALTMLGIYIIKNYNVLFGGNLESGRITAMSGNGILLYGMWLGTMGIALLFENLLRKEIKLYQFLPLCIFYSISILTMGFRSRLITLLILMILIYNKYHKIKVKKTIALGIALVSLVCALGVMRDLMSGIENSSFLKTMINLFQNGAINIHYIINEFPKSTPYQYGNTLLINLKMLMPGPDIDYTLWLKDVLDLSFAGGGVTPTILGDFYINFGYIGVILGFAILGIIVNVLELEYNKSQNTYFPAFLIWCLLTSVRGGITNTEIEFLLYSIVYLILIKIFNKMENKKTGGNI